jgi:hypothetical protein
MTDHYVDYSSLGEVRDECFRLADEVEKLEAQVAAMRSLIAIADQMFTENAAKVQAASDAKYQAEFGHNGPRIASPLDSAGRIYVFERHRLSREYPEMPDAAVALGQRTQR